MQLNCPSSENNFQNTAKCLTEFQLRGNKVYLCYYGTNVVGY